MSGTSLDGLDIAYCEFSDDKNFQLLAAETYHYPAAWHERLATLHLASAEEYARADAELGRFFGEKVLHCRGELHTEWGEDESGERNKSGEKKVDEICRRKRVYKMKEHHIHINQITLAKNLLTHRNLYFVE